MDDSANSMSTIEKAAARLVKTPKAEKQVGKIADKPSLEEVEEVQVQSVPEESLSKSKEIRADTAPEPIRSSQPDLLHDRTCELDFAMLLENGFLVPGHTNAKQNQEFRRIKRPLLLNLQPQVKGNHSKPTNVIFVTSALPAEGKTFVSLNLALSLAGELDRSVLLVDGDAAKGDLSRWMGIYEEPGLVDLLTAKNGYGEGSIIDTNVDRLSVMPCGDKTDNLDELYASDLMANIIEGLASRDPNRVIVVDGPPLLATTEAAVLAQLMGQTVMVVEANKTPQAAVEQAIGHLEGSQLVSLLLNKAEGSSPSGYGYGYGYGYGQEAAGGN